jgi:hypothetical protein
MSREIKKRLAVIILNWNGEQLLKQFIPTAVRHTIDADTDLIVADNGSTDGSVAYLRANHPQVKVIPFDANHGFSKGYNMALCQTQYEYTILLNSDVEVTPGWTRPLLQFMETHPEAAACQPKILSYIDKTRFEYAGAAGGYLDKYGYPYCRGRLFGNLETDHGQYDDIAEVAWASGAAMMVRTDLYLALGGLDESFFAHMEEIDLCCRMYAAGYKIFAIGDCAVYHVGGASLNQGNPRKTYLNFRNNLLLMRKNLPDKIGRKRLFLRRLLDTLAWLMFILKLDLPNANAVLRAHNDYRRMQRQYTTFPTFDVLRSLPGADRNILLDYPRFLLSLRHKKE